MNNIIPMPGQDDAKARADAETNLRRALFDWADQLLDQIGITQKVAAAKSLDDLQHVEFDANSIDVMFAIRAAMSPATGKVAKHFENMSEDKLKRIIRARFNHLVHERKRKLERIDTNTQYDPDICLPDLIAAVLSEYIDVDEHDAVAITLWTAFSHVYDQFSISPRLVLKSPEPGCGKSSLLDLLVLLCARGVRWDAGTAAAMFRCIDADHPSLMIDEVDCLDLAGTIEQVMRSGHRKGGFVTRHLDGANKYFATHGVMALAIVEKKLSEALLDRGVIIELKKTMRKDLRDIDDQKHIDEAVKPIYRQICAWARTKPKLNLQPDLPEKLHNRRANNWKTLISIADCFGEVWGKKARAATLASLRIKKQEPAHRMLVSFKRVFDDVLKDDRGRVDDIIKALHDLHDAPWNEYCGRNGTGAPHKICDAEVTQLLARYGIHPGTVWPKGRKKGDKSKSFRGYMRSWFEDAWARYAREEEDEEK